MDSRGVATVKEDIEDVKDYREDDREDGDYPWDIPLFDAHCHPTDTMGCVPEIQTMRARVLTIMATRAQDQDLVAQLASGTTVATASPSKTSADDSSSLVKAAGNAPSSGSEQLSVPAKIVPAFGWHPWFSHQIYIPVDSSETADLGPPNDRAPHKLETIQQGRPQTGAEVMKPEKSKPGTISGNEKVRHYKEVLSPAPEDEEFVRSLPDPISLDEFLAKTEARLDSHPSALIGEVGLDKAFRIPEAWLAEDKRNRDDGLTPGGREGRKLSPYRVQMTHQRRILTAQLRLAGKKQRAVSVHGVQAHGMLYDTLEATWSGHERKYVSKAERKRKARDGESEAAKGDDNEVCDVDDVKGDNVDARDDGSKPSSLPPLPFPPRICLHSYSGPPDPLKQYLHPSVPVDVYFSFSMVINFSTDATAKRSEAVIRALPADRILIESDMHIAGPQMDENLMLVAKKICFLKGWSLREGAIQLHDNWRAFIYGP